ncbi:MAG TPA: VWA domain-containing protein [Terracidiphilus sp.]
MLLLVFVVAAGAGQSAPESREGQEPVLRPRPPVKPKDADTSRVQLHAVVTDAWGKPVTGLQPWNFKLLDNGKPGKILYFRAFHGAALQRDPSLEVLLVLDALNNNRVEQALARSETIRFLEQNGGRLAHPVSLMVLTDKGLEVQPRPSADGKKEVRLLRRLTPRISVFNAAMGLNGEIERFNLSLAQIRLIAENETHKPGRKVLVWLGTGWPLLETQGVLPSVSDNAAYFNNAVELSNWLMEGEMTVCTVSPLDSTAGAALINPEFYKAYLKPVLRTQDASSGSLALNVLAVHSGGRVLGPGNDLAEQIGQCAEDMDSSYRLTFEPLKGQPAGTYHELKLTVDQPGVTVRTTSGYYSQP